MPIPAAPAPTSTIRASARAVPVARSPASTPATTTAAVPWMSSLKDGTRAAYRSSSRSALTCLKSSNWMTQPGQTASTPTTNASTSASYSAPRSRGARWPRYSGSASRAGLSVPDVERDRQRQGRVDAAGRGVQGELADRDGHAAGALVAEAEDPLVVGDDDEPDVLVRALAEQLRDPVAVRGRDPGPAGAADDVAELLARPPDRRRVDDGQELVEVLGEEPVEERRVAVLEGGQPDVALERVVLDPEVLELELDLLLDRQHPVRQEPAQPERVALLVREREVLGQEPAAEERRPGEPDRGRAAGGDVVIRVGQSAHPREDSGGGAGPGRVGRRGRRARVTARDRSRSRPSRTPRGPGGGRCTAAPPPREGHDRRHRVAGRDRHLGRTRPVDGLGAGPVAFVDGRVADDPLVVDGVGVDDDEPDRDAGRDGHGARREVRVVDLDGDGAVVQRGRPRPAAAIPASPSDRPIPPTRARRPGRRTVRAAPSAAIGVRRPGPAAAAARAAGSRRSR